MTTLNLDVVHIPAEVKALLNKARNENQRIVLMTCGLCGSGKSTIARGVESQYPTFTRLSIDKTILSHHGIYEVDYLAEKLEEFQQEAEDKVLDDLKRILREGKEDLVLDLAFYDKATREEYREIFGREGKGVYQVLLVVLRASEEVLWKRIEKRNQAREGPRKEGRGWEGMIVSREMLRLWMGGFEWPDGEGELLLCVED